MSCWWERYPDVFAAEKAALEALNYPWKIVEAAWESGLLAISVTIPYADRKHTYMAEYPDSYPYFPPEVFLTDGTLSRHQHPFGKNLCLLARSGEQWRPGIDTLAVLLREQLPLLNSVVSSDQNGEFVAANEDRLGEPLSSFLQYAMDCSIIVPDETPPAEHTSGRLKLLVRNTPATETGTGGLLNGVLTVISDHSNKPLVEFKATVPAFSVTRSGYWLRLSERPSLSEIEENPQFGNRLLALMSSRAPAFQKAFDNAKRGQVIVCGFVYPDEVAWRKSSDDWVFVALEVTRERKGMRSATGQVTLVKADWGGERAWLFRAPALQPLRKKSVLVVGLGSLGSPLVLQLARAGVRSLQLLDFDHLQVGNTVRWALGWRGAGIGKGDALARHIRAEYPYTEAVVHRTRIGETGSGDYERIVGIIKEVDLIVDASANARVNHFLADLTREMNKPYLWLTTTHGAAGGIVGRIAPRRHESGCLQCFLLALADMTIQPPEDGGSAEIQPGGCAQATFIGAGLDSDEIALLGARVAVATLNREVESESYYADFKWDVAVVDLYKNGEPIVPAWRTYMLPVHANCRACAHR